MKHFIAASLLLASLTLSGQPDQHKRLDPEQRAILKSKEMALHLDLSSDQQQQVAQLLSVEYTEVRKIRESMKDMDEGKAKRFELRNSLLDRKLALKENMKNILTSEQFELWQKHLRRNMAHRRHSDRDRRSGHRSKSPDHGD